MVHIHSIADQLLNLVYQLHVHYYFRVITKWLNTCYYLQNKLKIKSGTSKVLNYKSNTDYYTYTVSIIITATSTRSIFMHR